MRPASSSPRAPSASSVVVSRERTRRAGRPGSRGRRPRRPAARGRCRASSSRSAAAAPAPSSSAMRRASSASLMSRCRRRFGTSSSMKSPLRTARQRAARRRLRRGVQDHRAVGGAAHARVADADHVGDALPQHLRRQRHVADLGHARVALRAAVLQHQDAGLVDVEALVVDARVEVLDVLEDDGAAAVRHQRRRRRARLDDRAARREVAAQHGDAGLVLERRVERLDDLGVEVLGVRDVLAAPSCRSR